MDSEIVQLACQTHQCHIVLPSNLNDHATLFGGELLKWMDEVAYITAKRYSGQEIVTVSADDIRFREPVFGGMVIELIGSISRIGSASLVVKVDVFADTSDLQKKQLVAEGNFKFAAVDENHQLIRMKNPE